MAFGASTHWEYNTSGNNLYGGGFNIGNANMPTNLSTSNGTDEAPVVTSASYTFVAGDAGYKLFIKSGTNWIPGWYTIASVDTSGGTSATLTATAGAAEKGTYPYGATTVKGCGTAASLTSGTWAIDYSRSTTVKQAYTDLVIDHTTNTKITSASQRAFTVADVGNILNVTAGTGFSVQRIQIVSVSSGAATCDKAVGTIDSTGGTANYGGVLALPTDALLELSVAGNTWWLKENGDSATVYTLSGAIDVAAAGTTAATIFFVAYRTCRGEVLTKIQRPTVAAGTNTFTFSGASWFLKNIMVTSTSTSAVSIGSTSACINCKATASGGSSAQAFFSSTQSYLHGCEGICAAGKALNCASTCHQCYAHHSTIGISLAASSATAFQNIVDSCSTGIVLATAASVIGNTLYGNAISAGTGISGGAVSGSRILFNIIDGFVNGINITTAYQNNLSDYNNYYNNTTDVTGLTLGPNDIHAAPAFVNASGNVGSDLCTNGADWTGATGSTPPTGWAAKTAGTFTITGSGQAGNYLAITHNGTNNNPEVSFSFATTIGKSYKVTFYAQKGTATNLTARIGTTSGGSEIYSFAYTDTDWNTQKSLVFTAIATTSYFSACATTSTNAQYAKLDTVTIYEHAVDFTPGASCQLTIDWTKLGC